MYNFDSWLKTVTRHVGKESALLEINSSSIQAQVMQRLGFDSGSGNFTLVGVFSVHVFCSHLVGYVRSLGPHMLLSGIWF